MAKLKIDAATGKAEVKDGMPVYTDDNGNETTYDLPGLLASVAATRDERDKAQREARSLRDAVKAFGSSDEDRAKALEKLKLADSLDAKKLIDAGKVDEVVAERLKASTAEWQAKEAQLAEAVKLAQSQVRRHLITSRFATTKALDGTILTPDLAEAMFSQLFDVDGDAVVAFRDGSKSEKVYSRAEPAKVADFDEALSIHLQSHPNFAKWKKASGATGGASPGGAGSGSEKTVTRSQFDAMDPAAKMEFIRGKGTVAAEAA